MISFLTYKVQDRKGKLLAYLSNNNDELPLERQHQLYGAITELDAIMEILKGHRNKEINTSAKPDEVFLLKPIHGKGMLSEIKNLLKELF